MTVRRFTGTSRLFARLSPITCGPEAGLRPLITARLTAAEIAPDGEGDGFDLIAAALETHGVKPVCVFGVHG